MRLDEMAPSLEAHLFDAGVAARQRISYLRGFITARTRSAGHHESVRERVAKSPLFYAFAFIYSCLKGAADPPLEPLEVPP
jgi:hypothetical protein